RSTLGLREPLAKPVAVPPADHFALFQPYRCGTTRRRGPPSSGSSGRPLCRCAERTESYVLEALEDCLSSDLASDELLALTARADPVLAELWDNPKDARYDD